MWQAYENKFSEWDRSSLVHHEITHTRRLRPIGATISCNEMTWSLTIPTGGSSPFSCVLPPTLAQ
jgi:hypothetical protein